jgi:hypothetical protein
MTLLTKYGNPSIKDYTPLAHKKNIKNFNISKPNPIFRGPRGMLNEKTEGQKSRDTVPLNCLPYSNS